MACIHCVRVNRQPPLFNSCLMRLVVSCLCISWSAGTYVWAVPVALHFDAIIHTVPNGIPFASGLDFGVGEPVSGDFIFDPTPGIGGMNLDSTQPHLFRLRIGGKALSVSSFEILSVNNAALEDVPGISTIDSLVLGASGLTPLDLGIDIDSQSSGFRLTLFGPASTYGSAQIPSDLSVWNSFNIWKDLNVSLRNGNGGAIGLQATIHSFQRVPEPTIFGVAINAFAILFLTTMDGRGRGRIKGDAN